jgi:hypothetical protein
MTNDYGRTEERLIALHAEAGGRLVERASFTCPRCGERPLLFAGNLKWNDGQPVVECLCLAPFSPPGEIIVPEYRDAFKEHPEHYIWDFPPVKNADEWGMFVEYKIHLPCPVDDEELVLDE